MKQGKTLVQLAETLEAQAARKVDLVADTRKMHVSSSGHLIVNDEHAFMPTDNCHTQIAERLGIPTKYYREMQQKAPILLANNVNHWLGATSERRMIRGLNDTARAFLSDRYHRIDNEHVMETILPVLMDAGDIQVQSCEVTESRLYLKATSRSVVGEVKGSKRVGDFVEAGVLITNSEIGLGSLSIKPFMHFLACTNGMVRDGLKFTKYHVGAKASGDDLFLSDATKSLEDQAVLSRVRDVLRGCMQLDLLQRDIELMELAQQQRITGDVPKVIEAIGETLQLNQTERSGILRNLIESGDLSRYSLMNAITRHAQDVDSYDRATEIETLGGRVLDLSTKDWTRIAETA
jgi:hypothetical protein